MSSKPKRGERLGERAAAGHDLGPAVRDEVEGGEFLEDAHRVGRAEHRDRAPEADVAGPSRSSGEDHRWAGGSEVLPVVLAEPVDIQAHLVDELDLFEDLLQPPTRSDALARLNGSCRQLDSARSTKAAAATPSSAAGGVICQSRTRRCEPVAPMK
jgi:hypothetical protein